MMTELQGKKHEVLDTVGFFLKSGSCELELGSPICVCQIRHEWLYRVKNSYTDRIFSL